MSVLIDPYMFELTDEQEIRANLSFFNNIIQFSLSSNQEEKLEIALYKGVVEGLQQRPIQAFPIQFSEIKDKDLRNTIRLLNISFNNMLLNSIEKIDISDCSGIYCAIR